MKMLTLLLFAALALIACSDDDKDDNTVRYDEDYYYLINLASVKHGVIGRWTDPGGDIGFSSTNVCYGNTYDETLSRCRMYEITKEGGKYYLTVFSDAGSFADAKSEITYLSKMKLTTQGTKNGVIATSERKTMPPTP